MNPLASPLFTGLTHPEGPEAKFSNRWVLRTVSALDTGTNWQVLLSHQAGPGREGRPVGTELAPGSIVGLNASCH